MEAARIPSTPARQLPPWPAGRPLRAWQQRALEALAGSGLVPPLRMVRAVSAPDPDQPDLRDGFDVSDVSNVDDALDIWDAPGVVDTTPDTSRDGFAAS